jgi:hypothetical protein
MFSNVVSAVATAAATDAWLAALGFLGVCILQELWQLVGRNACALGRAFWMLGDIAWCVAAAATWYTWLAATGYLGQLVRRETCALGSAFWMFSTVLCCVAAAATWYTWLAATGDEIVDRDCGLGQTN